MIDDPRQLLRCPNGCGLPIDFTFGLRTCKSCGARLCKLCVHRFLSFIYCKPCKKIEQSKHDQH